MRKGCKERRNKWYEPCTRRCLFLGWSPTSTQGSFRDFPTVCLRGGQAGKRRALAQLATRHQLAGGGRRQPLGWQNGPAHPRKDPAGPFCLLDYPCSRPLHATEPDAHLTAAAGARVSPQTAHSSCWTHGLLADAWRTTGRITRIGRMIGLPGWARRTA